MKRMILAGVSAISLLTLLAACGGKTQPGAPGRHRRHPHALRQPSCRP